MPRSHGALMPLRYDVTFRGRVQGVNFRWTTCRVAQRFDVTGWVCNERDGSVRCVAEGDPAELDAFVKAVQQAMAQTPRASSIIENINSRLRNYFFLRRHIGHGYLDLLRFFLNHRRFLRSDRPERVGQSPAQLLRGQPTGHWLELLGYQRFCRN